MKISDLIGVVLAILVGLSLFPAVQDATDAAVANATAGSVATTVLPLIPMVYVVILLAGAAAYIYFKR